MARFETSLQNVINKPTSKALVGFGILWTTIAYFLTSWTHGFEWFSNFFGIAIQFSQNSNPIDFYKFDQHSPLDFLSYWRGLVFSLMFTTVWVGTCLHIILKNYKSSLYRFIFTFGLICFFTCSLLANLEELRPTSYLIPSQQHDFFSNFKDSFMEKFKIVLILLLFLGAFHNFLIVERQIHIRLIKIISVFGIVASLLILDYSQVKNWLSQTEKFQSRKNTIFLFFSGYSFDETKQISQSDKLKPLVPYQKHDVEIINKRSSSTALMVNLLSGEQIAESALDGNNFEPNILDHLENSINDSFSVHYANTIFTSPGNFSKLNFLFPEKLSSDSCTQEKNQIAYQKRFFVPTLVISSLLPKSFFPIFFNQKFCPFYFQNRAISLVHQLKLFFASQEKFDLKKKETGFFFLANLKPFSEAEEVDQQSFSHAQQAEESPKEHYLTTTIGFLMDVLNSTGLIQSTNLGIVFLPPENINKSGRLMYFQAPMAIPFDSESITQKPLFPHQLTSLLFGHPVKKLERVALMENPVNEYQTIPQNSISKLFPTKTYFCNLKVTSDVTKQLNTTFSFNPNGLIVSEISTEVPSLNLYQKLADSEESCKDESFEMYKNSLGLTEIQTRFLTRLASSNNMTKVLSPTQESN